MAGCSYTSVFESASDDLLAEFCFPVDQEQDPTDCIDALRFNDISDWDPACSGSGCQFLAPTAASAPQLVICQPPGESSEYCAGVMAGEPGADEATCLSSLVYPAPPRWCTYTAGDPSSCDPSPWFPSPEQCSSAIDPPSRNFPNWRDECANLGCSYLSVEASDDLLAEFCFPVDQEQDPTDCINALRFNDISDWDPACSGSGCQFIAPTAASAPLLAVCQPPGESSEYCASAVGEPDAEAACLSISAPQQGMPMCTYTQGVPGVDGVSCDLTANGCPDYVDPSSGEPGECVAIAECSEGTWAAPQACTGTATEIPGSCTGTADVIQPSCTGTANQVSVETASCGTGQDAFGTDCAVMSGCSDDISTEIDCVSTCTGTALDSSTICDLDPQTNSTADCVPGCTLTNRTYTPPYQCQNNTGSCIFFTNTTTIQPICELDPVTEDCTEGCIFTPATTPVCDLDALTDPQLGATCPSGCNDTAAVTPVCDNNNGQTACPAGCDEPPCLECTPGKYSDSLNSTSCIDCPAGTYGNIIASTTNEDCIPCVAGKYGSVSGSDQEADCSSCPSGQFQSLPGQTTCERCQNGTFGIGAISDGAVSEQQECQSCSPGQHDDDDDPTTACTDCFPGRYSDTDMSTQCTACPAGRFSLNVAAQAIDECTQCSSGQWSAAGSVQCAQCEVRYFRVAVHELGPAQAQLWSAYLGTESEAGCLDCAIRTDGSAREGLECPNRGAAFPQAAPGYYLAGNVASWQETVPPPNQVSQCLPLEACNGGIGDAICAKGYSGPRCAICEQGFYREGDLCPECPPGWPLAVVAGVFFASLLSLALVGDYLSNKYSKVSERLAPMMILMTYLQTTSLLLDVPLSWPPALRDLIKFLSIFNFDMDLAKPECSFPMDFKLRQIATLASPLVLLLLAKAYLLVQLLKAAVGYCICMTQRVQVVTEPDSPRVTLYLVMRKTVVRVKKQVRDVVTGSFVVASIFFLRTMVGGVDCSMNLDGKLYMDREPATECNTVDSYYAEVQHLSWIGLGSYAVVFLALVLAMKSGGARKFRFLSDKMAPQWFWWELVLLVRKIIIMAVALLMSENPEQGWFFASFVLVIAISLHSYARPFQDEWLNLCEYCSLFSTLLLFMAGMVFKVQSLNMEVEDAAELANTVAQNSNTEEEDTALAPMARLLVGLSIGLILFTTTVCLYAELSILCHLRKETKKPAGVGGDQEEPVMKKQNLQSVSPSPGANAADGWM